MSRKKKHDESHENHERWLLTYSDLITLLMIFFIVMYSMSNIDKEKYKQVAAGLSSAMGGGGATIIGKDSGTPINEDTSPTNTNVVDMPEEQRLEQVKQAVDKYLKESGLSDSVVTTIETRGLVLSFKDSLFFDSGKADIKPEQAKKLVEIGKMLNQPIISDSYIRVEGHTDNVPISTYLYKSNWDLSVIRASNVSQLLINQSGIKPDRVSAAGYGEFRPKADNNTETGRATNRRVDILIMNTKFNEVENNKK
ncbi:putative chemotaxis protein MotB [Clostridiales bacterium oral taxon 876 str. F0540]|nr:putative chemotaxis protein MotB [Clostridiales bacterium oral taxon 876 str. F0540]